MERKFTELENFYQNRYNEDGRMGRRPLEYLRCKEIISRYLAPAMTIADVGGATGAFSYWLAQQGHTVHLLDYTPLHIEQAEEHGMNLGLTLASCICGDARKLPYSDNSMDLVLVMGPLYHMQDSADRMACLDEAMRVLKVGGVLICEAISQYANLFVCFMEGLVEDERFRKILDENLATGNHNPGDTPFFTTAFFHSPELLKLELEQAEFADITLLPVEGFASVVDINVYFSDDHKKDLLLEYVRKTEAFPSLLGISGHLMAIAVKNGV